MVGAKRYHDALNARSYDTYRGMAGRIEEIIQDPETRSGMVSVQTLNLAKLGGGEAEALAGAGNLKDARQVVDDILGKDRSEQTLSVLRAHLDRVGHADWLPAAVEPPASAPTP